MQSEYKILILILNWNKKEFVLNLLGQLNDLDIREYDCLVVDNGSTDDSVEQIRKNFPDIDILRNETNLGGTGGYNSGLRYALDKNRYDYVWLIDNDTNIEPDTLSELVKVLNSDKEIAIAGSRIVDIDNREITIELGAYLNWKTVGVNPNLRNTKNIVFDYKYVETDYVAICSALIRTSALDLVGLMDERHFIFWDDIDWGLSFRKKGFKVVAVPSSIVYHPSFTERDRGITTDFYYSIRNSLLVYSKNTNIIQRIFIFYKYLSYLLIDLTIYSLNNNTLYTKFGFTAIYDFIFDNWGKCTIKTPENNIPHEDFDLNELDLKSDKCLIIFDRYNDDGIKIMELIKDRIKKDNLYSLIDLDRVDIYKDRLSNVILMDANKRKTSLLYNMGLFLKLYKHNFRYSFGSSAIAYAFATKQYFVFSDNKFHDSKISIYNLHKLALAGLIGGVVSLLLTPVVMISSLRYKEHKIV